MTMGGKGRVPGWVRWVMSRLMTPGEVDEALSELEDLRAHCETTVGPREAERRFRSELRGYPMRLMARRFRRVGLAEPGIVFTGMWRHLRALARTPVLTSTIVLTVGVGIGGCTAIFAVADILFLRPLPYSDSDRLVWIYTDNPPYRFNFSVVDFQALQQQQTTFDRVAAFRTLSRTLVSDDLVERQTVWEVTPGFFEVLGVAPVVGRTATPDEGEPGAPPTVLVTSTFAATTLGAPSGEPGRALGTTVRLDDVPYEVIGVLPDRSGPLGAGTQLFVTQQLESPTRRGPFFQRVVGRLGDGLERPVAEDELRAINRRVFPLWQSSYQDENATWAAAPLAELLHGNADRLVVLLTGSVGLLLLLATTNAANLLVTRVRSRARELSVRVAIGASRTRVVIHLLSESALLAAAGAVVGLGLAKIVVDLMPLFAGAYLPRLGEVELVGRPLAFAALLAVVSGLFFGLLSALQGSPTKALDGLRAGSRSSTSSRGARRAQRVLVGAQLALAVPLLVGAGLLGSSLRNLNTADAGFDARGLLTARISLSAGRYPDAEERRRLWQELRERAGSVPGVVSVGIADSRPPVEAFNYNNYDLEDAPTPPGESQPVAAWVAADAGYLETLGVPLLEGRLLTEEDEASESPPAVVVDERWARRHFPGASAVDKRLREGGSTTGPWTTVVGVVGEVPYAGFAGETGGTVYAPWTDFVQAFLVTRVQGDPHRALPAIREELRQLDPTAPMTDVETGETLIQASLDQPRHLTVILAAFSAVALALAVIGLYGVTAHAVQAQRGDIAVRLALGGTPRGVMGQVVRSAMTVAAAGLMVGAVVAPAFTRLMAGVLYEVGPADPLTLSAVVALLATISLITCAVPARRAVAMAPRAALSEE